MGGDGEGGPALAPPPGCDSFDLVVVGTGLVETLLAACAAAAPPQRAAASTVFCAIAADAPLPAAAPPRAPASLCF